MGLRLTLGPQVEPLIKKWEANSGAITVGALPRFLDQNLMSPPFKDLFHIKNVEDKEKIKTRVTNWLHGKNIEGKGYLDIQTDDPAIQDLALDFLSTNKFDKMARLADGVIYIQRGAREYLAEFELRDLRRIRSRLQDENVLAYFTHLAEGRREDPYNSKEFGYARDFGLLSPKFVAIHGVGFAADDFKSAAASGISVIWSPSSNLWLYGETLRFVEARDAGVKIGLGSDWSITGTKTILDEARVAARSSRSDGRPLNSTEVQQMLTKDAAEIISPNGPIGFGELALGYKADITVLSRSILTSHQDDVALVVVNGEPVYGDSQVLAEASRAIGDMTELESLPVSCLKKSKSIRLIDKKTGERVSYSGLKAGLVAKFMKAKSTFEKVNPKKSGLNLDPLFVCEDTEYQSALSRLLNH